MPSCVTQGFREQLWWWGRGRDVWSNKDLPLTSIVDVKKIWRRGRLQDKNIYGHVMPSNLKCSKWCHYISVLHSSAFSEENWSFKLLLLSFWALEWLWFDLSWWRFVCSLTLGISGLYFVWTSWVISMRCLVPEDFYHVLWLFKKKRIKIHTWRVLKAASSPVFFKAERMGWSC